MGIGYNLKPFSEESKIFVNDLIQVINKLVKHTHTGGIDDLDPVTFAMANPIYLDATTYLILEGNTVKLYVKGSLRQEWTTDVGTSGQSIGLLLALTYPT